MFYPEDALVRRTPGIATVWLMATLGARQHSKKVSRQAILKVDIPQACNAIHNSGAPLALRLQSNLLYGISRVYLQKCAYILTDAEAAQVSLKNLFRFVQTSELDPQAGRARPESLVVPDDPSFIPDIHFAVVDFDISSFDSSGASFLTDSNVSGVSKASSRSEGSLHDSNPPQLLVPSSASFGSRLNFDLPRSVEDPFNHPLNLQAEETGFLQDLGFEFDVTGNIVDHDMLDDIPQSEGLQNHPVTHQEATEREDQRPVVFTDRQDQPLDEGFLPIDEIMMQAEESIEQHISKEDAQSAKDSNISEYVEAHQVRRKRAKVSTIPRDRILQILNSELQQWDHNYVDNMRHARKIKESRWQSRHAKLNATALLQRVSQSCFAGGGGTADVLIDSVRRLLEELTGITTDKRAFNIKRKRRDVSSEENDLDSEARKARLRMDGNTEAPRGQVENEEGFIAIGDDMEPSIELAREAMTMMEDQSTQLPLPWSGSRAGSVHSARLSRQSSIVSARAQDNTTAVRAASFHSFDRRASRIPSASPVPGRASMLRSSDRIHTGLTDNELLSGFGSGIPRTSPHRGTEAQEFELFGPAAGVSTQEAADSQWLRDALNKESTEFLAWIENSIAAKKRDDDEGTEEIQQSIKFDELLPAMKHSRAVAAQGFLHVLILASRGAIEVTQNIADGSGQPLWWAPLDLRVTSDISDDLIEV